MDFIFRGVFLGILLGLLALNTGCNVDGERWNRAMREAWQSLGLEKREAPLDSGFYLYFADDVAGVVEGNPEQR